MIDTIIFDFAGVVTKEGFLKVFLNELKKHFDYDEYLLKQRFLDNENVYMNGSMNSVEFWRIICQGFNIPYSEYEKVFRTAYEFNQDMIDLIRKLKPKYQIILFSDNFDILSEKLRENLEFTNLFHKVFFSNEIGLIKQSPGSFEYILKSISKKGNECVFVDDKRINLVPAEQLGVSTILYQDFVSLKNDFKRLGLQI